MSPPPLTAHELALIHSVFRRHPEIASATLFGSRAKGTHTVRSDVDLVVSGAIEPLRAEAIAAELDELPLPYRFEVQSLAHIAHLPLREHIERVGIAIYPDTAPRWDSSSSTKTGDTITIGAVNNALTLAVPAKEIGYQQESREAL